MFQKRQESTRVKFSIRIRNIQIRKVYPNHLMIFFVNIGNMVEEKIPAGKTKFTDYLNKRNINNLFLYPVDDIEIKSV